MNPIVIDHGSYKCRAGFAGEDQPRTQFLSIIGRPKTDNSKYLTCLEFKGPYIGQRLLKVPLVDILQLSYPIEFGHVTNWDDVEETWRYVFCEKLKVDVEEHPVLLTETTRNPRMNREKSTEIMFESFNVPAFYLAQQAVLSLFSAGIKTGIVLDIGHSVTRIVPVYEGHNLVMGNTKLDFGGSNVTDAVWKMLKDNGVIIDSRKVFWQLRDVVESSCYTSTNYNKDLSEFDEFRNTQGYQLPGGRKIPLGIERFKSVELFFQPTLFGFECYNVHELLNHSITRLDKDIQNDMFSNIVLSGGASMYPNFDKRLQSEMEQLNQNARVIAPPERHLAAWRGGAKFASLPEFSSCSITKAEYDEHGPSLVRKKCF